MKAAFEDSENKMNNFSPENEKKLKNFKKELEEKETNGKETNKDSVPKDNSNEKISSPKDITKSIHEKKEEEETGITDEANGILKFGIGTKGKGLYPKKGSVYDQSIYLYENKEEATEHLKRIANENGINQKEVELAIKNNTLYSFVKERLQITKDIHKFKNKIAPIAKKETTKNPHKNHKNKEHLKKNDFIKDAKNLLKNGKELFYADENFIKIMGANGIKTSGKSAQEMLKELEKKIGVLKEQNTVQDVSKKENIKKDKEKKISPRFWSGKTVSIQKTSGRIENDWKIRLWRDNENAFVIKEDGKGGFIEKLVPIKELERLNPLSQENGTKEDTKTTASKKPEDKAREIIKVSEKKEGEEIEKEKEEKAKGDKNIKEEDDLKLEMEKKEKTDEALNKLDENIEEKAEKEGLLEMTRNVGEWYKKRTFVQKLVFGVAFGAIASAGVAMSSLPAMAIGTIAMASQRGASSASILNSIEKSLKKRAGNGGEKIWHKNPTETAALAGLIYGTFGGAIVGATVSYIGTSFIGEYMKDFVEFAENKISGGMPIDNAHETILSASGAPKPQIAVNLHNGPNVPDIKESVIHLHADTHTPTQAMDGAPPIKEVPVLQHELNAVPLNTTYEVQKGDNLWKIIEGKLSDKNMFDKMGEGQRTYLIDSLKDKFAEMSPDDLKEIGISSGNIDNLSVGDNIDLSQVFKEDILKDATGHAESLSNKTISSIVENNAKISEWVAEHHNEALTSEKVESILNGNNLIQNDKAMDIIEHTQNNSPSITPNTEDISTVPDVQDNVTQEDIDTAKQLESESAIKGHEILEQVNIKMTEDINNLYGSKGIFGIGATKGIDSAEWKEVKGMNIGEIFKNADNSNAVDTMKVHINDIVENGGVAIDKKENIEHFLRNTISKTIK